jgi:hypothetical protein
VSNDTGGDVDGPDFYSNVEVDINSIYKSDDDNTIGTATTSIRVTNLRECIVTYCVQKLKCRWF